MSSLQFSPLQFLFDGIRKYGDIFTYRAGQQRVYFINNPEYIKDVLLTYRSSFVKEGFLNRTATFLGQGLLTSEGEFHRRERRLVLPAFHAQRIAGYGAVMTACAESASSRWSDGGTIELFQEMNRMTLNIVAKALFSTDLEEEGQDVGKALTTVLEAFNLQSFPLSEGAQVPLLKTKPFEDSLAKLDKVLYGIIEERRRTGEDAGDLLSMLILATDEEGGGSLTDLQLRDEAMTIFLAGHETMANAMTWTWYLLSQHPDVESKLHQEIETVLGDGRLPAVSDLPRLQYVEKVLTESMRLYPPVWTLGRLAVEDCTIGGHHIPKGSVVAMSQYVAHRNPKYFPEPEKFWPERWTQEAKDALPPFAYFPFGGGPRRCVGEGFAWAEGILDIATIARHWKLMLAPGQKVEIQPLITLRPKNEIQMITKRVSPPA